MTKFYIYNLFSTVSSVTCEVDNDSLTLLLKKCLVWQTGFPNNQPRLFKVYENFGFANENAPESSAFVRFVHVLYQLRSSVGNATVYRADVSGDFISKNHLSLRTL